MDTTTTPTAAVLNDLNAATPAPAATKPGLRTTEFWITLAVILVNHVVAALRASQSPAGQLAASIVDALAASSYSIARALAKRGPPLAIILLVVATGLTSCATFNAGAKACEDQVTPELVQIAGAALAGQDYEGAIVRDLGQLAACLRKAAVAAAVDQAKHWKWKAAGTVDQAAIARHGDAWLSAHGGQAALLNKLLNKPGRPAPAGHFSAISPALTGSTSRRSAARAGRGSHRRASRSPGRPPTRAPAWWGDPRARRALRRPSRRSRSGRTTAASVLQVA